MSGSMYAGSLCSTQIGARCEPDDGPIQDAPFLIVVIHGRQAHPRHNDGVNVRMVLRSVDGGAVRQWCRDVADTHVVRVEDPS